MNDVTRKIKQLIEPATVIEGAGVKLRRSFGPSRENLFDPFLLFDHFAFNDPIEGPIAGFPTHPHRGIETVTYMLEGNVRHRDSLGNTGVIGPGEAQWMTSGRGILHEEMPKRGPTGNVKGFQLWVNLPADQKISQPRYQEVMADEIPTVQNDGVNVRVVAGEYEGVQGAVKDIAIQPLYMDVALDANKKFTVTIPEDHTAAAYVFEGKGIFDLDEDGRGEHIEAVNMIIFENGALIEVQAAPDSNLRFILISGAAINETIVPYGPFVMNTEEEIQQAFVDLRNGTFVQ